MRCLKQSTTHFIVLKLSWSTLYPSGELVCTSIPKCIYDGLRKNFGENRIQEKHLKISSTVSAQMITFWRKALVIKDDVLNILFHYHLYLRRLTVKDPVQIFFVLQIFDWKVSLSPLCLPWYHSIWVQGSRQSSPTVDTLWAWKRKQEQSLDISNEGNVSFLARDRRQTYRKRG